MNSKRLTGLIILIFTIIIGCLGNHRNLERPIVARDGRYEKYDNGIVHDTVTELEWYTGPDKSMTWYQTKDWVESLRVAGGGWRMPTIKELRALYQAGVGTNNLTPLITMTGWMVWSGEFWRGALTGEGRYFAFSGGYEAQTFRNYSDDGTRALAVRSQILGYATTKFSVRKPETYKAVFCSSTEKKKGIIYPINLTERFTSGDGKKVYIFIDWYDLEPQTKNTVRYAWYDPNGEFDGSWGHEFTCNIPHWKTTGFKKLDRQYNITPGQWTVKVFFNNHYIFSKNFMILENSAR